MFVVSTYIYFELPVKWAAIIGIIVGSGTTIFGSCGILGFNHKLMERNKMEKRYKINITKKKFNAFYNSPLINKLNERLDNEKYNLNKKEPTLHKQCEKHGAYPYIPLSSQRLLAEFLILKKWIKNQSALKNPLVKTKDLKFLDMGSGIGNVLLLANIVKLAFHYTGIEFNEPTFRLSQKVLDLPKKEFELILDDIITYKFELILDDIITYKGYDKFDILYYYCPFKSSVLGMYFEELLEDRMSLGTILMPHLKLSRKIHKDSRFTRIILTTSFHTLTFFIKTSA